MNWTAKLKALALGRAGPAHLRVGRLGERAAKRHLKRLGLKFLVANYRSQRGEIDLVFRDHDCLVFAPSDGNHNLWQAAHAMEGRLAITYIRFSTMPPSISRGTVEREQKMQGK